jgi:arabinogalactan endo-1,4-beta-galactosidase
MHRMIIAFSNFKELAQFLKDREKDPIVWLGGDASIFTSYVTVGNETARISCEVPGEERDFTKTSELMRQEGVKVYKGMVL